MKNDIDIDPQGRTARRVHAAAADVSRKLGCPPDVLRDDFADPPADDRRSA